MDHYRLIIDGPTDFAIEITHDHGIIHTTGGFHTLLAADAWMADRQGAAEAAEASRTTLRGS